MLPVKPWECQHPADGKAVVGGHRPIRTTVLRLITQIRKCSHNYEFRCVLTRQKRCQNIDYNTKTNDQQD